MPIYQHKTRGFRLAEDAYLRRVAQGEFSADEFVEFVQVEVPAALEPEPEIEEITIVKAAPLPGPPSEKADDDFFTRPAPRKSRR